jgi:hypothetical protein
MIPSDEADEEEKLWVKRILVGRFVETKGAIKSTSYSLQGIGPT